MKLVLNLSQVRYYHRRRIRALLIGITVCGTVLSLMFAGLALRGAEESSRLKAEIAGLQTEISQVTGEGKKVPADDLHKLEEAIEEINQIALSHGFRWSRFLLDLEEVVPKNARVRSITPGHATKPTSVQGVATDLDALQELLRKIQASPRFGSSYLLHQAEGRVKDTQGIEHDILTFTLSLKRVEEGK